MELSDLTRRMICGGVAGMVAKTVTNPLERVKMLAQTGEAQTTGIIGIYQRVLRDEGILGLWAGNGVNLIRVMPSKAVVFSSNDVYREVLLQTQVLDKVSVSFWAGGLAGMTATAVTYPLDVIRGRISGKVASRYNSIWSTVTLTVREEGIRGLYRGLTPTLLGSMPYVGIQFGTVGTLERLFPEQTGKPLTKMLFGGCGGIMAGLITYPNDTVRRLLQLQGSRGTTSVYRGYWDCVRQTVRSEGVSRLYRGLGINLIRMAPNSAVQFGTYELLKQMTASPSR